MNKDDKWLYAFMWGIFAVAWGCSIAAVIIDRGAIHSSHEEGANVIGNAHSDYSEENQ
jgi:hypothetical protein